MTNPIEWTAVTPGDYELVDAYRAEAAIVNGQERYVVVQTEADPDDADVPQRWTVYAVHEGKALDGRGVYGTAEEAKAAVVSAVS